MHLNRWSRLYRLFLRTRRFAGRAWPPIDHSLTLGISSLAALFLMLVVAILLAFMQFQARLLSSMPNVTPGQLIEFVEAERQSRLAINKLYQSVGELKEIHRVTNDTYLLARNEIESFCSLFTTQSSTRSEVANTKVLCTSFMRTVSIPGSIASRSDGDVNYAARPILFRAGKSEIQTDDDLAFQILSALIMRLDGSAFQFNLNSVPLPQKERAVRIASINANLNTILRSRYEDVVSEYNSSCYTYNTLQRSIPYRRLSSQACESVALPNYWEEQSATSDLTPAAGGPTDPSASLGRPVASSGMPRQTELPSPSLPAAANPTDHQRSFELVSNYMFYSTLDALILGRNGTFMEKLILSPGDYIAIFLIVFCGMLGGFINILFLNRRVGKDPTLKYLFIDPVQGMVCGLIFYILLRSGVVAIADNNGLKDITTISPFFLAFVGIAAGLMAGRVVETFQDQASSWLKGIRAGGDRWAIGLAAAMKERSVSAAQLAKMVGVREEKIEEWKNEREEVPTAFQATLAAALGTPQRVLFTSAPPVKE